MADDLPSQWIVRRGHVLTKLGDKNAAERSVAGVQERNKCQLIWVTPGDSVRPTWRVLTSVVYWSERVVNGRCDDRLCCGQTSPIDPIEGRILGGGEREEGREGRAREEEDEGERGRRKRTRKRGRWQSGERRIGRGKREMGEEGGRLQGVNLRLDMSKCLPLISMLCQPCYPYNSG